MAEYDKLSEVTYNPAVRAWRFRVKLHRIYPFYSCVTNSGPYYNYILADEDGYKMEMNTYGNYKNFRGLEKEEGRWVEIFVVDVERAYPCFKTTRSPFRLIASRLTQVRIIEPLNNRLFFDFKSIHAIPRMHWRDLKYPIGMVITTDLGMVISTVAWLGFRTLYNSVDIEWEWSSTRKPISMPLQDQGWSFT
ncbi:BnaA03g53660D [Brassica napus]|uniref:BnaA03g53660D protein n=1 Tax=Brassica napus TaxID=3708 RepID=A0A078I0V2_BRANA|nr:BnaA03g53660D [Brassica napus]